MYNLFTAITRVAAWRAPFLSTIDVYEFFQTLDSGGEGLVIYLVLMRKII